MESVGRVPVLERTAHRSPVFEGPVARAAVEKLDRISQDPSTFIDEGGACRGVYRLPSGTCMKVLQLRHDNPNSHLMRLGNTLEQEAEFLEDLEHFSCKGVRTPGYLGRVRSGDFLALLMEELPAVNLQKVLNGEQTLPESFDADDFFDSLEFYIEQMHSERHVAHCDLEARNVMVDVKTGKPRVIDFGNARRLDEITNPDLRKRLVQDDWDKLDRMAAQIEKFGTADN